VFNVVDYSSVVLPVSKVDKVLNAKAVKNMKNYDPRNAVYQWNWENFDVETMDGMLIGVQVVARRLEKEKALGAASMMEKVLSRRSEYLYVAVSLSNPASLLLIDYPFKAPSLNLIKNIIFCILGIFTFLY